MPDTSNKNEVSSAGALIFVGALTFIVVGWITIGVVALLSLT